MAKITSKLKFKKNGVVEEIDLYDTNKGMKEGYIKIKKDGGIYSYAALSSKQTKMCSSLECKKNGITYYILKKLQEVTIINLNLPTSMRKSRNGQDFYGGSWEEYGDSKNQNNYVDNYISFSSPGKYIIRFQADEVGVIRGGKSGPAPIGQNGYGYMPESAWGKDCGSNAGPPFACQSAQEIGYNYAAFYGIRIICANGDKKWILVANNRTSRMNEDFISEFELNEAEVGNGETPMQITIYESARDGHSWSENGTIIRNPRITITNIIDN